MPIAHFALLLPLLALLLTTTPAFGGLTWAERKRAISPVFPAGVGLLMLVA